MQRARDRPQDSDGAPAGTDEQRAILALLAVYWLLFQIVFFFYGALGDASIELQPLPLAVRLVRYILRPSELAIVAAGGLLCYGVYLLLRRAKRLSLGRQLLAATLASVGCAAAFSIAISVLSRWFGAGWPDLTLRFFIVDVMRWCAPFGLWAGFSLVVTYERETRARERRLASLAVEAHLAQVRALRYQISPHFLYNTLNSIATLILDGRNDRAESMVVRLASFFRASLAIDALSDVPLHDEIRLQQLYLDIEKMRFADQLTVDFDIPAELAEARVPSLILQPLIENALKHGLNDVGQRTCVRITARRAADRLLIEVADNGPGGGQADGVGIGLKNVRARLAARFGDEAAVDARSEGGQGFVVQLRMPLELS